MAERDAAVEGVANFRDLGGYRSSDGRHVRWGQVFRSGELGAMTPAGRRRFDQIGVRTIVDFRTDFEVAQLPDPEMPGVVGVRIPVVDAGSALIEEITRAVQAGDLSILGPDLLTAGNAAFVRDFTAEFAHLIRCLAGPAHRPAVIHCTAGKDRAGFGAAVLLLALGVPRSTVIDDYLLSNDFRAAANRAMLDAVRPTVAAAQGVDPGAVDMGPLAQVLEVRGEYLQVAFDAIADGYGTVDGYLRDGLGLTDADLTELRDQLLE